MKALFKIALVGTLILVGYAFAVISNKPHQEQVAYADTPVAQDVTTTTSVIPAPTQPEFSRSTIHNIGVCQNARTRADYTGVLVSREEVNYWAAKYWSGWNLSVADALTIPEGQRDLNCIGDELSPLYGQSTSDGRHYGESIGLYQYRTIIEATGKGGCEDISWQSGNIERETDCAFQKWNVHHNFNPWSTYTTKNPKRSYKTYLGK